MAWTQPGGAARFSCPRDFTATSPASDPPCFSLEALTGPDTELWLIQAPVDFAPHCLNGRRVPLSGSQIVKGKVDGKRHRYRVLSSSGPGAKEATLLVPSADAGGGLICAPAPHGSLRIIEGPQGSLLCTSLQPIPASPPPQIPPGLRPRFCAFGGSPPVTGPGSASALKSPASGKRKKRRQVVEALASQEAVNGHGALEVDAAPGAVLEVTEPAAEALEPLGGLFPATSKKKKKRKPKGGETGEPDVGSLELAQPLSLELGAKTTPPDGTVLSPSKKRKRPKGAEGLEPEEETMVDSQAQVTGEPQEEAIALPPGKKTKKEKRCHVMTEEPGTEQLRREETEPELPSEVETRAEVAQVSPKKRKRTEKSQDMVLEPVLEPTAEVARPEQPCDPDPQAALASTKKKKKKKKERGPKTTEPRTEMTGTLMEIGESVVGAALGSPKKKKKRGEESGVPEMGPQGETPPMLLDPKPGEAACTEGREKKRKRKPQQDSV